MIYLIFCTSFVIDFKDTGGYPTFEEHYEKRKKMMVDSGVKMFNTVYDFMNMIKEVGLENINYLEK